MAIGLVASHEHHLNLLALFRAFKACLHDQVVPDGQILYPKPSPSSSGYNAEEATEIHLALLDCVNGTIYFIPSTKQEIEYEEELCLVKSKTDGNFNHGKVVSRNVSVRPHNL